MPDLDLAVSRFSDVQTFANMQDVQAAAAGTGATLLHDAGNGGTTQPTSPTARAEEKATQKTEVVKALLMNAASKETRAAVEALFTDKVEDDITPAEVRAILEQAEAKKIQFTDIPAVGQNVKVTAENVYKGLVGEVMAYDAESNKVTVSVSLGDGEPPIPMTFDPSDVSVTQREQVEAMDNAQFIAALSTDISVASLQQLAVEVDKLAGDEWMLTGSSALMAWANELGVEARQPGDIDLLVSSDAFEIVKEAMNTATGANTQSKTSVTYRAEAGRTQSLDLTKARGAYGSLEQRETLSSGISAQSLEGLLRAKEGAKAQGTGDMTKIDTDLAVIEKMIQLKTDLASLEQLEAANGDEAQISELKESIAAQREAINALIN